MSKDILGVAVRKLVTLPGPMLGTVCDLLEKLSDPEWGDAAKRFLRKENPWPTGAGSESSYPVTVDYDLSLAAMIRKGAYDYVNPDITAEHFPVEGEGRVDVDVPIIGYDRPMTSDEVLADFAQRGLRAATLPHGLAVGEKYPDLQREGPVVLFGSGWHSRYGHRLVPYLWGDDRGRSLGLRWFDDSRWDRNDRFAAVRTES